MSFAFTQSGSVDPGIMLRAMRARKRPSAFRLKNAAGLILSVLFGAIVGIGGMAIATIILLKLEAGPKSMGFLGPLLGVSIAFLIYQLASRVNQAYGVRQMLASPLYGDICEFKVDEDGFSMKNDNAKWRIRWPAIDQIKCSNDGIYLYAGNFTYVLPISAVPEDQFDLMWAKIQSWTSQ